MNKRLVKSITHNIRFYHHIMNQYQCSALTLKGTRCKFNKLHNAQYCHIHQPIFKSGKPVKDYDPAIHKPKVINNICTNINYKINTDNNYRINDVHNNYRINDVYTNYYNNNVYNPCIESSKSRICTPIQRCQNQFNDPTKCSTSRKTPKIQPISIESKSIESKPIEPEIVKLIEPLVLAQLNTCQCCFCEFPPDEIVMCTGANSKYIHITCYDCLKGYFESVLDQKKSVGCMMSNEGCNGRYHDHDVKKSLSDEQYNKYTECLKVEEALQFTILDDYHMCPFCSKYGIIAENVDRLSESELSIECKQCLKSWCVKCRNESHVPDPCGKLKTSNSETVKHAVAKAINDSAIHKCPKCQLKFIKEEGCNLITCSSCKTYSCYLCGLIIVPKDDKKYWHFKGAGSAEPGAECPLYNSRALNETQIVAGNTDYNNKKVIRGLTELLKINTHDREIFTALHTEITNMGYIIDISSIKLPEPVKATIQETVKPVKAPIQETVKSDVTNNSNQTPGTKNSFLKKISIDCVIM